MKKWIGAALVLLLLFAGTFAFLPANQKFQKTMHLGVNARALHRTLLQQTAQAQAEGDNRPAMRLLPGAETNFVLELPTDTAYNSQIKLLGLSTDTTLVMWQANVQCGNLPWQRWAAWWKGRSLANQVSDYLQQLKSYEQQEKLYGLSISFDKITDSVLVTTRFSSAAYPTTPEIYKHINLLRQYIARQGATATNHPMLLVRPQPDGYLTQVAIPTNRRLPDQGAFFLRRLVVAGNILKAEVQGGQWQVEEGLKQLENFATDNGLSAPALPYSSLVTDRTAVQDSSKWVTRIYYPIY